MGQVSSIACSIVGSDGFGVVRELSDLASRDFGGEEYNQELGLDWYDVTARNYDPALGRWMNIDPLAHRYSNTSAYIYT